MPILLDRMPFPAEPGEIVVRGQRIKLRADQIILWMTLGAQKTLQPNPAATPFPVILDTGHSHSFSIQERHLIDWVGLRPESLAVLGAARDRGQKIMLHAARLWAHANLRGERDKLADRPPYLLEARAGIAVYRTGDFPRLPILGLRAIAENGLVLRVCGRRRQATLRTPMKWWWPFS